MIIFLEIGKRGENLTIIFLSIFVENVVLKELFFEKMIQDVYFTDINTGSTATYCKVVWN